LVNSRARFILLYRIASLIARWIFKCGRGRSTATNVIWLFSSRLISWMTAREGNTLDRHTSSTTPSLPDDGGLHPQAETAAARPARKEALQALGTHLAEGSGVNAADSVEAGRAACQVGEWREEGLRMPGSSSFSILVGLIFAYTFVCCTDNTLLLLDNPNMNSINL